MYQDGQFSLWVCHRCGHTITAPNPSTYTPNTICHGPHYDESGVQHYVQMTLIETPKQRNAVSVEALTTDL